MSVFIGLVIGLFYLGAFHNAPVVGAVLGALCGWVYKLSAQIKTLETSQQQLTRILQSIQHQGAGVTQPADSVAAGATAAAQSDTSSPGSAQNAPDPAQTELPLSPVPVAQPLVADTAGASATDTADTVHTTSVAPEIPSHTQAAGQHATTTDSVAAASTATDAAEKPDILSRGFSAAKDWLLGGNPFVRAGIVLLFIGFVFLMRYSLEKNLIPVEVRLLGSALTALALLGFGWKFRQRVGAYGLILQAGGVGLLYLTVFAAFGLYQLLPSFVAFTFLILIVAAAVGLAVLQNSLALAMFAFAGGFLAPILVSSGSNNYIGLFSFYALLNVGIVCIAWFKSWRLLNLLGFVFTFAIAAMWGWSSYQPANFATVEPFLVLFFLFYVAIAILFALRTPVSFKDKVDSTLVFGTPILGFVLQVALVREFEYGIAMSALVLGGFYLLLSAIMWKKFGRAQQLLCETFVVLGVIFTTLAIPFAVDGAMTSAAWAIEGAGVLWISIRQRQWLRRGFAVLLQYAALVSLLLAMVFDGLAADAALLINGQFIAGVLVSAALLVSSRLLGADFASKRGYENALSLVLLISGVLFLTVCFEAQILHFWLVEYFVRFQLGYALFISLALLACARIKDWPALRFALPMPVILMALSGLAVLDEHSSLFSGVSGLLWPLTFVAFYAVLYQYQQHARFTGWLWVLQVVTAWLLIGLLSLETQLQMQQYFEVSNGWYVASLPLVSIAAIWLILKAAFWPLRAYSVVLLRFVALPLAGLLALWVFFSLGSSGASQPLPWLPLLNPLDVVTLLLGMTLFQLYRQLRAGHQAAGAVTAGGISTDDMKLVRLLGGGLGFVWLNVLILRAMHHWYGLPWSIPGLLATPETQTVLAIVWTLSGLLFSWFGSRRGNRYLWFVGTALLALVVLKLFLVDFSSSGTMARIVSFLSVGVLLLFVGFLAPMPPAREDEVSDVPS